jgi:hypothetical protein
MPMWRMGRAMHYVIHDEAFFGGLWHPDWIYNSAGALQILTWASLALESTCWIFVWPLITRRVTVLSMVLFHLGIELAMNLHTFQWMSMLGWLAFLIEVDESSEEEKGHSVIVAKQGTSKKGTGKNGGHYGVNHIFLKSLCLFGHVAFPLLVVVATAAQTFPLEAWYRMTGEATVWPVLARIDEVQSTISSWAQSNFLNSLGLDQDIWDMYHRPPQENTRVVARINYRHNDTEHYWTQAQWTMMSGWEKKALYRQVLFWKSVPLGKGFPEEMVFQRAICQRIAEQQGPERGAIYSIALKAATADMPPFNRAQSFEKSPSVFVWLSTPARPKRIASYSETLLYVHYPSGDRRDGIDKEEDFTYGWEHEGFWWDDQFFSYNPTSNDYELAEYQEDPAEQMNEESEHEPATPNRKERVRRQEVNNEL